MTDLDLKISGSSCDIDCRCSRWDVQNYSVIVETWVTKSQLQDLRNSVRPGATGELYSVLGRPRYYDKSWTGNNTIVLSPNTDCGSNLYKMRKETVMFPRNITTSPLESDSDWIFTKIEGYVSGSGDL